MSKIGYQSHNSFSTPSDDTQIFHSMHLNHFIEAIEKKQIRFSSIASFRDPNEGEMPYNYDEFLSGFVCMTNDGGYLNCLHRKDLKQRMPENEYNRLFSFPNVPLRYILREWKQYLFAHCWSLDKEKTHNENESEQIVTIETTIGQIKNALSADYDYHIGKIKYINYLDATFDFMEEFVKNNVAQISQQDNQDARVLAIDLAYERHLHKWLKYQSEQEVRIIIKWKSFTKRYPEVEQIIPTDPYANKIPEKLYEENYLNYKDVDFSKLIGGIKVRGNVSSDQNTHLESSLVKAEIDLNKLDMSEAQFVQSQNDL